MDTHQLIWDVSPSQIVSSYDDAIDLSSYFTPNLHSSASSALGKCSPAMSKKKGQAAQKSDEKRNESKMKGATSPRKGSKRLASSSPTSSASSLSSLPGNRQSRKLSKKIKCSHKCSHVEKFLRLIRKICNEDQENMSNLQTVTSDNSSDSKSE